MTRPYKFMTTGQVRDVIRLRKSGCSYRFIADTVQISYWSVSNILRRSGMTDPKRNERLKAKAAMLLHDWQTGLSGAKMAKKYGYKSRCGIYSTVTYLRSQGWPFEYRNRLNATERAEQARRAI